MPCTRSHNWPIQCSEYTEQGRIQEFANGGPVPPVPFLPILLPIFHCCGAGVTNLNEPPSSFLPPFRYCGLRAGSIPLRAIVNKKQCETRGLFMSLVIHYWIGDVQDCQGVSASEMTYIVSSGALNSTHSLTLCAHICIGSGKLRCDATLRPIYVALRARVVFFYTDNDAFDSRKWAYLCSEIFKVCVSFSVTLFFSSFLPSPPLFSLLFSPLTSMSFNSCLLVAIV